MSDDIRMGLPKDLDNDMSTVSSNAEEEPLFEGYCHLRTKSLRFKRFWISVKHNHIFFYKHKDDDSPTLIHSLTETFFEARLCENIQSLPEGCISSVKIIFPGKLVRTMYLSSKEEE